MWHVLIRKWQINLRIIRKNQLFDFHMKNFALNEKVKCNHFVWHHMPTCTMVDFSRIAMAILEKKYTNSRCKQLETKLIGDVISFFSNLISWLAQMSKWSLPALGPLEEVLPTVPWCVALTSLCLAPTVLHNARSLNLVASSFCSLIRKLIVLKIISYHIKTLY